MDLIDTLLSLGSILREQVSLVHSKDNLSILCINLDHNRIFINSPFNNCGIRKYIQYSLFCSIEFLLSPVSVFTVFYSKSWHVRPVLNSVNYSTVFIGWRPHSQMFVLYLSMLNDTLRYFMLFNMGIRYMSWIRAERFSTII